MMGSPPSSPFPPMIGSPPSSCMIGSPPSSCMMGSPAMMGSPPIIGSPPATSFARTVYSPGSLLLNLRVAAEVVWFCAVHTIWKPSATTLLPPSTASVTSLLAAFLVLIFTSFLSAEILKPLKNLKNSRPSVFLTSAAIFSERILGSFILRYKERSLSPFLMPESLE